MDVTYNLHPVVFTICHLSIGYLFCIVFSGFSFANYLFQLQKSYIHTTQCEGSVQVNSFQQIIKEDVYNVGFNLFHCDDVNLEIHV